MFSGFFKITIDLVACENSRPSSLLASWNYPSGEERTEEIAVYPGLYITTVFEKAQISGSILDE